jgi:cytochrome b subunit of formate dehydrogenase
MEDHSETTSAEPQPPTVSEDVYHQLTIIRNFRDAPGCIDCHTAHDTYPADDIRSSVHPASIAATCSGTEGVSKECHSKTTDRFLSGSVHHADIADRFGRRAGSKKMWLLAIFLVAPLAAHIIFDAIRAPRAVLERKEGEEEKGPGISSRMTAHQRVLHFLLIVLFLFASAGGLALRLNDRDPAARLIETVGGIEAMATIHLITGLALAALIVYHIVSLLYLSIKRDWAIDELILLPDVNDLKNIIQNAKFFFFLSADFPRFRKYSFVQKFDYFTGLAGLTLMFATGIAVGLPERAALLFSPAYIEDVRTFHITLGYVLIFVFLVWHVYNNLLSPGKFFANWSWISGSTPEGLIATYHAAYHEEVLQRDREQRLERERIAEEQSMQRTIKKQSQRLEEYLNTGNEFAKQERFDEAVEQYRRALELLPKFPKAQYNLATVYQKAGNLAQAAVEYRKFIEMDPFNVMVEKVRSVLRELEEPGKEEPTDDE